VRATGRGQDGLTIDAVFGRAVGLLVGVGTIIVLLSCVAAALLLQALQERDRVERVNAALGTFLAATVDAETAVRGFLVVGRESFLAPYRSAGPRLAAASRVLRESAEPDLAARADELLAAQREWDRVFARRVIGLVREGRRADGVTLARSEIGARRIRRIRALVEDIRRMEQSRLRAADSRVRVVITATLVVLLLGTLGGGVALRNTARRLDAWVARPLAGLREAARAMAEGRRDVRVPVAGTVETREVAEAFNAMVAHVGRVEQGLRELDELKSRFVSSVSHELRTPLTSIRGYLEMLLDGEEGELTADQRAAVAVAHRNAERLDALIGDLLLLARIEAGRQVLERVHVDLREVAEQVEAELRPAADARDLRIEHEDGGDAVALGDRRALEQVAANLLSNAVKFSPQGATVRVRVVRRRGEVLLEVADEGPGMPPEDAARIGERFFRARTAAGVEGTGLGLAITREIVERLDGRLEVDTAEGAGATFRVRLPAAGA